MAQIFSSPLSGNIQSQSSFVLGGQLASTERFQDFLKSYAHSDAVSTPKETATSDEVAHFSRRNESDTHSGVQYASYNATENFSGKEGDAKLSIIQDDVGTVQKNENEKSAGFADASFLLGNTKLASPTLGGLKAQSSQPQDNSPVKEVPTEAPDPPQNTSVSISDRSAPISTQQTNVEASTQAAPEIADEMKMGATDGSHSDVVCSAPSVEGPPTEGSKLIQSSQSASPAESETSLESSALNADLDGFSIDTSSEERESISEIKASGSVFDEIVSGKSDMKELEPVKEQQPSEKTTSLRFQSAPTITEAPVIRHVSSELHTNTEIEMSLGAEGKVHVSIDEGDDGERHIHVRAESPEILKSFNDDRNNLFATLNQTVLAVSSDQPIIPTDLTLSLMGSFSQGGGEGSSQEGSVDLSRSEEGSTDTQISGQLQESILPSRTILRGVIDLTA